MTSNLFSKQFLKTMLNFAVLLFRTSWADFRAWLPMRDTRLPWILHFLLKNYIFEFLNCGNSISLQWIVWSKCHITGGVKGDACKFYFPSVYLLLAWRRKKIRGLEDNFFLCWNMRFCSFSHWNDCYVQSSF